MLTYFNVKEETVFQDHAVEKHALSFVLFGKIKCVNLASILLDKVIVEELNSNGGWRMEIVIKK